MLCGPAFYIRLFGRTQEPRAYNEPSRTLCFSPSIPINSAKQTFSKTRQKLYASQVGQRKSRIGAKRAKNFHLLMKGKIRHLELPVQLSQ